MPHLSHALEQAIVRLTAAGQPWYTERQLYYEVCRVLRPLPHPAIILAGGGLAASVPLLLAHHHPRLASLLATGTALTTGTCYLARWWPATRPVPLEWADFQAALQAYRTQVFNPHRLLSPAPSVPLATAATAPDLFDYGLPHLFVCQHTAIAQMLLANLVHMEARCLILDVTTASPLPATLKQMLTHADAARILVLHDASRSGLALMKGLRQRLDAPAGIPIRSIGLRPIHAQRLHLFAIREQISSIPPGIEFHGLPTREQTWLQHGWSAEIAAVRPAHLLRALRRIIIGAPVPTRTTFNLRRERTIGFMTWPDR